jgi:hypothetical protein
MNGLNLLMVNKLKTFFLTSKKAYKHWILLGIPVIFVAGFFLHYAYEWSGNSPIVGLITPVNESIWEHLKLAFFPLLVWWSVGYYLLRKYNPIPANQWFSSCAIALLTSLLTIVSFYYTYTGALGIESAILDIFSLLLGLMVAQCLGLHTYQYAKFGSNSLRISTEIILFLTVAFFVFTFVPPHLPLFMDSTTGLYGIPPIE